MTPAHICSFVTSHYARVFQLNRFGFADYFGSPWNWLDDCSNISSISLGIIHFSRDSFVRNFYMNFHSVLRLNCDCYTDRAAQNYDNYGPEFNGSWYEDNCLVDGVDKLGKLNEIMDTDPYTFRSSVRLFATLGTGLCIFKILYYLRGFQRLATFVGMILHILGHLKDFTIILFLFLAASWLMWFLQVGEISSVTDDADDHDRLFSRVEAYVRTFHHVYHDSMYGPEYLEYTNENPIWTAVIMHGILFFTEIVMLNLLIAIMGDGEVT